VNLRDDRLGCGHKHDVIEWSELAEWLVELDFAIEDREFWATRPEDIAELEQLEQDRNDIQTALSVHHMPSRLRRRLRDRSSSAEPSRAMIDPRD
jgi:hypothetical protein